MQFEISYQQFVLGEQDVVAAAAAAVVVHLVLDHQLPKPQDLVYCWTENKKKQQSLFSSDSLSNTDISPLLTIIKHRYPVAGK